MKMIILTMTFNKNAGELFQASGISYVVLI